jgi:hypothetical protein
MTKIRIIRLYLSTCKEEDDYEKDEEYGQSLHY